MFSFVDDVVLDPFLGTGSTTLAAMRAGRHSVGIEVDPQYFSSTVKRVREAVAQGGLFPEDAPAQVIVTETTDDAARTAGRLFP